MVAPPNEAEDCPEPEPAYKQTVDRLRLLWNQRHFLRRVAGWGLVATALIAFLIPKQYESTTRLMPPDNQSSSSLALMATLSGKMSGGLGALAGDVLGIKSSGALFIGILRSRTVQDSLINKFDLRKVYGKSRWDGARQELAAKTYLSEDRKSGIITITVNDRDPQRAATLAQQYVTELNAVVRQASTSSARRERVFLEERLRQVKQDLETAEKDFSEFASKTGAIDIKEQGRAMVTAAATLQGQLIAVEAELEGLKQIYTDNNVRVRSLRARAAELRAQLGSVGGKDDILKDATNPDDKSLYPSIRKLPLLGVPYGDLYRRAKVQEAVFETLIQSYELAKVAEVKELPSVTVLDPAAIPEGKSFPPRLTIIFVGTLLCCALASFWVLAKARWDEMDSQDSRKGFAREVFHAVNANMPWATPNGSRFQALSHIAWMRVIARRGPDLQNTSSK